MCQPHLNIDELKAAVTEKLIQNPKELEIARKIEESTTKSDSQINTLSRP